jgi:predicted Zn-dependent protease
MPRHWVLPPIALVAALGQAGCARNPATGQRQLSLISEGQEIRMGREYDPQIIATMGLYPDSGLQRYIQQLGARLAATSERPALSWTFRVVDDPIVNAFAVPGGFIYVTRGILAHFNSEAELAAVLGHEIGHVTARHSVTQLSRQQLAQFGLAVGSIVSPEVERFSGLASAALGVLFLKHSRDAERQADELGLRYMRRGGFDAREMPDVFTMLERVSTAQAAGAEGGGGGRTPEWLATHPNPENRRERIQQQIAALPRDSLGSTVNAESYLGRVNGIVFGDNPREGFFKRTWFYHPELRFQLVFPDGWKTANQKQGVVAVSPQQDAMVQLTLASEPTADAAARAFLGQQGVVAGAPDRSAVNGLPAVSARFQATTESGTLRGIVMFVEHGGRVFHLMAYAGAARWGAYQETGERALRTFERLTDPALLDVQPWRVEIVRLDREAPIDDLARRRPSPATPATLALINQTEPTTRLAAGTRVKWVVGKPLP